MKRYSTPISKIDEFETVDVMTTSGTKIEELDGGDL